MLKPFALLLTLVTLAAVGCTPVRYANTLHGQLAAYHDAHAPAQAPRTTSWDVPVRTWTAGAPNIQPSLPVLAEETVKVSALDPSHPEMHVPRGFLTAIMQEKDDGWNGTRRMVQRFCHRKPDQCPTGHGPVMVLTMARIERIQSGIVSGVDRAIAERRTRPRVRTNCYFGKHYSSCTSY